MLLVALALADVTVLDTTQCVDGDRLDNELSLLLGERLDAIEVEVRVQPDGELRDAEIEVRKTRGRKELLHASRLPAAVGDCPAMPEAIALVVQRGLEALPHWTWAANSAPPVGWRFGLGATSTGKDHHLAADLTLERRLLGHLQLWGGPRVLLGLPLQVGDGHATRVVGALIGGPALQYRHVRAWLGAGAGPLLGIGSGFERNEVALLPYVVTEGGASLQSGSWFVGLTARAALIRPIFIDRAGANRQDTPVSVGLVLGRQGWFENPRTSGEGLRREWASWDR